jgi:hypothetical protein
MEKGAGLVCLHYAVEVPKDRGGPELLKWIGGYFEVNWSVNPHWNADFKTVPDHPITRGVKPFKLRDEWYYHMRFPPQMSGVTPILTAVPPASTLERRDGLHEGNEAVREEVARQVPQHVAWAIERPGVGAASALPGRIFIGTGATITFVHLC